MTVMNSSDLLEAQHDSIKVKSAIIFKGKKKLRKKPPIERNCVSMVLEKNVDNNFDLHSFYKTI